MDLALAPGRLFGRPRWPWIAAPAVANLATAILCAAGDHEGLRRRGRHAAMALAVVTAANAKLVVELRRQAQESEPSL